MACAAIGNRRLAVRRFFAFVLLTNLAFSARADERVLVETVPAGVEKATALTVVRDALKYRAWTIVAQDADSVSATISRQAIDARIRISFSGTRLLYEESARGKGKLDYTGRWVPSVTATPERWINYLRSDISAGLQERVAAGAGVTAKSDTVAPRSTGASEEPARRGSAVQRMQELKEMFDKGLISADEYARKRDDILKGL